MISTQGARYGDAVRIGGITGYAIVAWALLPACGTETVGLGVDFPSERSFLLTEYVEIDVFPDDDCATAIVAASNEPARRLASATGMPCELRSGSVVVEPIPPGTVAIVVRAFHPDASATEPILRGCRVVTIDRSPPSAVAVALDYTPTYFPYEAAVAASGGPACTTATDLCSGACTP